MTYQLDPDCPLGVEVRRVAAECLDDAIDRLRQAGGPDRDLEEHVHQIRKRCKEARGLVRLVRPALGDGFASFNAEVRDGARELSSLRDAHALLGTVEDLADSPDGEGMDDLETVAGHLRVAAAAATHGVDGDDPRLAVARGRLETARAMVGSWPGTIDIEAVAGGVAEVAARGRAAWKVARKGGTDDQVHEWRKRVKYLWYQARLLEAADPDGIRPLVEDLDELSDLLGDEHDLTVLVEHLEHLVGAAAMAGVDVDLVVALARARQADLRAAATELGRSVYGDGVDAIVERLVGPWSGAGGSDRGGVERERTFLVGDMPDLPDDGTRIRQGYLALDGDVQVRVRKIRYVIPVDGADAEFDVFAGAITGLVLVEVEFDSEEDMAAFEPPAWFGPEVTDDDRYSNASLAVSGLGRRRGHLRR